MDSSIIPTYSIYNKIKTECKELAEMEVMRYLEDTNILNI